MDPSIGDISDFCDAVRETIEAYPELIFNRYESTITLIHVVSAFTEAGVPSILKAKLDESNVNERDCLGRVPLHYAVLNSNEEMVSFLLNNGADPNLQIFSRNSSNYTHLSNTTNCSKLLQEMPTPDEATSLHIAVKAGNIEVLKLLLQNRADVNIRGFGDVTPLMLAVTYKKNTTETILKLLIDYGADVHLLDSQDHTALFYATVHRHFKAVEMLLEAGAWLTKDNFQQTAMHEAAKRGVFDILFLLLNNKLCDETFINDLDAFGRTPLYWTACSSHTECFKLLMKHHANIAAGGEQCKDTVMDAVFATFSQPVEVIREILDEGISMTEWNNHLENSRVTLDREIASLSITCSGSALTDYITGALETKDIISLANMSTLQHIFLYSAHALMPFNREKQMEVIEQMLEAAGSKDGSQLLQHPLVESFIRLKWRKIVYFFYLQLITYLFFTTTLSTYVLLLVHRIYLSSEMLFTVVRYMLIFLSTSLLGHALVQCFLEMRMMNIRSQYELWIYVFCNIFSLVIACIGSSITRGTDNNDMPDWIFHSSSIAVLLSWVELMLLIGRFPKYGYYALMFSAVLQNVVKVLCTFICLVIGFAISFSIQFWNSEEFQNPWRAVVKTTVMMMGEFEYSDLFGQHDDTKKLPVTSRVIFLFFIILTSIVLVNLMVGLAVNDIQALQTEGHVRGLQKRRKFLRQLERVVYSPVVNSKYFPTLVRDFLKRRCCIQPILKIQPTVYLGKKKFKKLPAELIESIVRHAKCRGSACERLKDIELKRFLNCLQGILEKYNTPNQ